MKSCSVFFPIKKTLSLPKFSTPVHAAAAAVVATAVAATALAVAAAVAAAAAAAVAAHQKFLASSVGKSTTKHV